jgi:hypothetical protein
LRSSWSKEEKEITKAPDIRGFLVYGKRIDTAKNKEQEVHELKLIQKKKDDGKRHNSLGLYRYY